MLNIKHLGARLIIKVQNDLFETVWFEIKNKDSKNIVCGCIYRHPRAEVDSFFNYIDSTLKKISEEGKEVYICGDFNKKSFKTRQVDTSWKIRLV